MQSFSLYFREDTHKAVHANHNKAVVEFSVLGEAERESGVRDQRRDQGTRQSVGSRAKRTDCCPA